MTRIRLAIATSCLLASSGGATSLEDALSDVARDVTPAIVSVTAIRSMPGEVTSGGRCEGSGVLLESGLIATTMSVAGPRDHIRIRYSDGHETIGEVVASDPLRELSLIRPRDSRGVPLAVGESDSLHAGSWVFVVGFSLRAPEASFATGRFSSRTILNLNDSTIDTIELLQLEANVYPGNSGAAVVDTKGRLVGVILGGLGSDGFLDPAVLSSFEASEEPSHCVLTAGPPIGISFALPARDIERFAERVSNDRADKAGYLGVRVAMSKGAVPGVRVDEVVSGSPAALAGLRAGDRLLRLGDRDVPDPTTLAALVRELPPGTSARLEFQPHGASERRVTEITLGDYACDYRMRLIWNRLMSWRTTSLEEARTRMQKQLDLVNEELERVRGMESSVARASR